MTPALTEVSVVELAAVRRTALRSLVARGGLHRFALARTRDLADHLVHAAVHPDAADSDGGPVELVVVPDSEAPVELLEHLGDGYVRADVMVFRPSPRPAPDLAEITGLFTGPRGSWSIVAKPGSCRAWARSETCASITARAHTLAAVATEVPPR